jgi:hypothetical protein
MEHLIRNKFKNITLNFIFIMLVVMMTLVSCANHSKKQLEKFAANENFSEFDKFIKCEGVINSSFINTREAGFFITDSLMFFVKSSWDSNDTSAYLLKVKDGSIDIFRQHVMCPESPAYRGWARSFSYLDHRVKSLDYNDKFDVPGKFLFEKELMTDEGIYNCIFIWQSLTWTEDLGKYIFYAELDSQNIVVNHYKYEKSVKIINDYIFFLAGKDMP